MKSNKYQVIIPDEATRLCIDKDLKETGMNESQLIRLIITKYYFEQANKSKGK
jgi:hypothetical protein